MSNMTVQDIIRETESLVQQKTAAFKKQAIERSKQEIPAELERAQRRTSPVATGATCPEQSATSPFPRPQVLRIQK